MGDAVSFEEWRRAASERILGDESLMSALVDQESRSLVSWGLARIEDCLRQAHASGFPMRLDELPPCIEQVRKTMRGVNLFIQQKDDLSEAEATERLQALFANAPGVQVSDADRAYQAAELVARKDRLSAIDLVAVLSGIEPQVAARTSAPAALTTAPVQPDNPLVTFRRWLGRLIGR